MNGLITTTPPNATSPIWGQIAKLCRDYSTRVASLITILETFRDNPEIGPSLVHDSAIAELKKAEAGYCKSFEALVNISNSTTATYHTLVESHGNCERLIKELTASGGNPNLVTHSVLIIQTQKALIEREMLETEECQCQTWQTIQAVQFAYEVTVKVTKEIKQSRKKNEQRPEPKVDEMEGESSSGPSQAE